MTKKVEKTEPIKKTIPKPTKKITKEVPVVSLNKKVIKNKDRELNKKIEDAINRIKSENKESDDKIEEAINRIKKESSEQGNSTAKTYAPHGEGGVIVSGIADLRYKIYYTIIWGRIKEGWILPESLIKNKKDLEAIVSFKILRNGEIMDISFEKSSGNSYFDKSALRAVEKANPLPSLPADHKEVYLEIGVRFHSSEL
ncbi:MAG: energy transducer TonB [Pseudomonadota bacterium]